MLKFPNQWGGAHISWITIPTFGSKLLRAKPDSQVVAHRCFVSGTGESLPNNYPGKREFSSQVVYDVLMRPFQPRYHFLSDKEELPSSHCESFIRNLPMLQSGGATCRLSHHMNILHTTLVTVNRRWSQTSYTRALSSMFPRKGTWGAMLNPLQFLPLI